MASRASPNEGGEAEGIRARGAADRVVGPRRYYRRVPSEDPIPNTRLSQVLHVAARTRGGDIPWSMDGSRGLAAEDVDRMLALEDDGVFVTTAFEAILGRRPDPAGLAFYAGALEAGMDRSELLLDFAESSEGRSRAGTAATRAVIRARRLAPFIHATGSMIDRQHLSGSSRIDHVWPFLWVDAVRSVIPGVLEDPADVHQFTADIGAGRSPRDAVVDAWTAGLRRASFPRRMAGRLRRRFRWHRTWAAIDARFRANVAFYSQLGHLLDGERARA